MTVGTACDELGLRRFGYRPTTLDAGCCGLAGSYGFAVKTAPVGEKIARAYWLPKRHEAVDATSEAESGPVAVTMDGFYCITQLKQLDGLPHRTVASRIAQAMN